MKEIGRAGICNISEPPYRRLSPLSRSQPLSRPTVIEVGVWIVATTASAMSMSADLDGNTAVPNSHAACET
jgi:hypothetical protein